ncbi:MAG: hypothetical protein DMF79_17155 [Acidobacteria bacterium]|nr:MAG: hypothetical protein DMF79_17155 [Acidobacteriota bacterium]
MELAPLGSVTCTRSARLEARVRTSASGASMSSFRTFLKWMTTGATAPASTSAAPTFSSRRVGIAAICASG